MSHSVVGPHGHASLTAVQPLPGRGHFPPPDSLPPFTRLPHLPPELQSLVARRLDLRTLLTLRASGLAFVIWLNHHRPHCIARAMCAGYGCELGPAPYESLGSLRASLRDWYAMFCGQHAGYSHTPLFKSLGTVHLAHNMGMVLGMDAKGEVTVYLAPAEKRGRRALSTWRWKPKIPVPVETMGERYVDRILLSGDGFGVFVMLEKAQGVVAEFQPHRILFQVVDLTSGKAYGSFPELPWSPASVWVDPTSELYQTGTSVALCGQYVLFPGMRNVKGRDPVERGRSSACVADLRNKELVLEFTGDFAFATFLDRTTLIILETSSECPKILDDDFHYESEQEALRAAGARSSAQARQASGDECRMPVTDSMPVTDTKFVIFCLNRRGQRSHELMSPMTVVRVPGFRNVLPAMGAAVGFPHPRGPFLDRQTVFRLDEQAYLRYVLPDVDDPELASREGRDGYVLAFFILVHEMDFCLDDGNRPHVVDCVRKCAEQWAHGRLRISGVHQNLTASDRTMFGTVSDLFDYHCARSPRGYGPMGYRSLYAHTAAVYSHSRLEVRQKEWVSLRFPSSVQRPSVLSRPSTVCRNTLYALRRWDVDGNTPWVRHPEGHRFHVWNRQGMSRPFPDDGTVIAVPDVMFRVKRVSSEGTSFRSRFDEVYGETSFLTPVMSSGEPDGDADDEG